jgi:hypothetical protein
VQRVAEGAPKRWRLVARDRPRNFNRVLLITLKNYDCRYVAIPPVLGSRTPLSATISAEGHMASPAIRQQPRRNITFKRFLRDESGATAIEYGLIAAGISVATSRW